MLGRNGQSGCWGIWWKELEYTKLEYGASTILESEKLELYTYYPHLLTDANHRNECVMNGTPK